MSKETDNENNEIPNPAFEPARQRLDIQVGSFVQSNDAVCRIAQVLDFETAAIIRDEIKELKDN